jgi:hypothetical protein
MEDSGVQKSTVCETERQAAMNSGPDSTLLGASELGGPSGISSLPTSTRGTLQSRLHAWYFCSALRVLKAELGSLRHRIRMALEIHAWGLRGYRGRLPSVLATAPTPAAKNSKRGYIRYTQQILDRYPFLTIVDLSLVEQGWMAGWEFGCHTCSGQSQDISHSSANPMARNSMPLPEDQQSSKCNSVGARDERKESTGGND